MRYIRKIQYGLLVFLLCCCNNANDPLEVETEESKYKNHYKILFRIQSDLYTIHSDGTNLVRLTSSNDLKQHAIWSPDGSKIAYCYSSDLITVELQMMDRDGTNIRTLSRDRSFCQNPKFTKDGEKIIFQGDGHPDNRIYSVRIDGSDQLSLPTPPEYIASDFCLHPIDNKVLCCTSFYEIYSLCEIDITNWTYRKILEMDHYISYPMYSHDGSKIIFSSNPQNNHCNLFQIKSDGTELVKITNLTYPDDTFLYRILQPIWSPDDSQILFRYADGIDYNALYIINSDGSNLRKIAEYGYAHAWSPDMTRISYHVYGAEIIIYDIETGSKTKLTDGYDAVWSKIKL